MFLFWDSEGEGVWGGKTESKGVFLLLLLYVHRHSHSGIERKRDVSLSRRVSC